MSRSTSTQQRIGLMFAAYPDTCALIKGQVQLFDERGTDIERLIRQLRDKAIPLTVCVIVLDQALALKKSTEWIAYVTNLTTFIANYLTVENAPMYLRDTTLLNTIMTTIHEAGERGELTEKIKKQIQPLIDTMNADGLEKFLDYITVLSDHPTTDTDKALPHLAIRVNHRGTGFSWVLRPNKHLLDILLQAPPTLATGILTLHVHLGFTNQTIFKTIITRLANEEGADLFTLLTKHLSCDWDYWKHNPSTMLALINILDLIDNTHCFLFRASQLKFNDKQLCSLVHKFASLRDDPQAFKALNSALNILCTYAYPKKTSELPDDFFNIVEEILKTPALAIPLCLLAKQTNKLTLKKVANWKTDLEEHLRYADAAKTGILAYPSVSACREAFTVDTIITNSAHPLHAFYCHHTDKQTREDKAMFMQWLTAICDTIKARINPLTYTLTDIVNLVAKECGFITSLSANEESAFISLNAIPFLSQTLKLIVTWDAILPPKRHSKPLPMLKYMGSQCSEIALVLGNPKMARFLITETIPTRTYIDPMSHGPGHTYPKHRISFRQRLFFAAYHPTHPTEGAKQTQDDYEEKRLFFGEKPAETIALLSTLALPWADYLIGLHYLDALPEPHTASSRTPAIDDFEALLLPDGEEATAPVAAPISHEQLDKAAAAFQRVVDASTLNAFHAQKAKNQLATIKRLRAGEPDTAPDSTPSARLFASEPCTTKTSTPLAPTYGASMSADGTRRMQHVT